MGRISFGVFRPMSPEDAKSRQCQDPHHYFSKVGPCLCNCGMFIRTPDLTVREVGNS